jgi:hypothetical protein
MAVCPRCNYTNPDTAVFCGNCASSLGPSASAPALDGAPQLTRVVLMDIQMTYTRMVEVLFKWTFAALLVGFVLGVTYFFLSMAWKVFLGRSFS